MQLVPLRVTVKYAVYPKNTRHGVGTHPEIHLLTYIFEGEKNEEFAENLKNRTKQHR